MTDQPGFEVVLESIAQIAKVTESKRAAFKDAAFFALCFAEWSSSGGASGYTPRDRKAMRAIVKATIALQSALKQRTRRVENALRYEWLTRARERDWKSVPRGHFSQWLDWPRSLADLADHAHRREINRRRQNKRGAPAGFRNSVAYELATGLRDAANEYGGKLAIDKTVGAGSLLTALELCKPLLPESFRIPSAMTLDRMTRTKPTAQPKSVRSKKRKSTAKKPNS